MPRPQTITSKDLSVSRSRLTRATRVALRSLGAALVVAGVAAPAASAEFGIRDVVAAATPTQAGAPADFRVNFAFNTRADNPLIPDGGGIRHVRVSLPPGLVGDPNAVPTCRPEVFVQVAAPCPAETQVGKVLLRYDLGFGYQERWQPVFNLVAADGEPASFGFNVSNAPNVQMVASVRPDDFGIDTDIRNINQAGRVLAQDMTLWGIPADPAHDGERSPCLYNAETNCTSSATPATFLRNPTRCDADLTTTISVASWQAPDAFLDTDVAMAPRTGCDQVPFEPQVTVTPQTTSADAPSGLDVELTAPQSTDPEQIQTSDLRDAVVTLPKGWTVSPSIATELEACDDAGVGIGSAGPPACPPASRLGSAEIDSPLLSETLTGPIIAGPSPSPGKYVIYVVVQGSGVRIKLEGEIDADPKTGRLTTTFKDSPQQPFTRFSLRFDGGDRAALASPAACGTDTTTASLTPWSGTAPVVRNVATTFGGGECGERPFAPAFQAGVTNPTAGASSPFTLRIARADRTQEIGAISSVSLPKGLVAEIGSVPLCPEANAAAGTCSAASQVGRVEVSAGPGAQPLGIAGRAYLTGGYRGAPYGLSLVVPALAGPYDLGTVVVRSAIRVSTDAQVTVETDPLPTILGGVPLRLRSLGVVLDRPGFMRNPTNCAASTIGATLGSVDGANADVSTRFQVGACEQLAYQPTLTAALTGKTSELRAKGHPGLAVQLRPRADDANQQAAQVTLPLSLALDPGNAKALCEPAAAATNRCPAASIVGVARATSILHDELTSPVYFVRGERTDPKSGRIIKTLPSLYVPLSANGVRVDMTATSSVVGGRLRTTFDDLPDVPLKTFALSIAGGENGILTVTNGAYCANTKTQTIDALFTGQNRRRQSSRMVLGSPCRFAVVGRGHGATSALIGVSGISAGRVTVSGKGLKRTARTITAATVANVRTPLTAATRRALRRGKHVTVRVTATFRPAGATKTTKKTATVVLRARR
ncbi:MAG: hypothetical protein WC558_04290 [Patulibacter sp.]